MIFEAKPLDTVTQNDLETLITDQEPEGKRLEYKRELPGGTNDEKKEFLADFTSFANASGGYLLFGVEENAGVPTDIPGLDIEDIDEVKLRFENMIREGIEPRISNHFIHPVSVHDKKTVLIIHIRKSWNAPHIVKFQNHSRFYSRNSAGKYQLDVGELRTAFLLSNTIATRIRDFRAERLSNILAAETPIALENIPKVVLHCVPFNAFDSSVNIDVVTFRKNPLYRNLLDEMRLRYNLDGLVGYSNYKPQPPAQTYLQIFRSGIVEYVDAILLDGRDQRGEHPIIPSLLFQETIAETLTKVLLIQQALEVELPIVVMLSLLGVKGYVMSIQNISFHGIIEPIDRNDLLIPEALVETFDVKVYEVLKPSFDTLYNASGLPQSLHYDENGNWKPQRY